MCLMFGFSLLSVCVCVYVCVCMHACVCRDGFAMSENISKTRQENIQGDGHLFYYSFTLSERNLPHMKTVNQK